MTDQSMKEKKIDELADKLKLDKETVSEISKFAIDVEKLKSQTTPNPVVVGGMEAIGITRISPFEIPKYLLMHPALPRGIDMKVNRIIKLVDQDLRNNVKQNERADEEQINFDDGVELSLKEISEKAKEYCRKILYNSGGPLFIKRYAQEAYRFGTSFSVLQTDDSDNEVLRFEIQHPIFFGPSTYPKKIKGKGVDWKGIPQSQRPSLAGKMKINPKTKEISKYTQLTKVYPERSEDNYKDERAEYVNTITHPGLKDKSAGPLEPTGKEIDSKQVMQLMFDRIGDEPLGISLVQFLHLTIKYLLNMEKAGAQTMVNFGFNKWKANTPFKDFKKMQQFGKTLANIQKDSVVVLPEGIELENIQPGQTEFADVHPIFMKLIAIRLGIPMALLTQDGNSTNKATIEQMRKDMYEDFVADEMTIEVSINDGFFKACQIKWPELSIEQLNKIVPNFEFKQPPEDIDSERERDLKFTLAIRNLATSAETWGEIGDGRVLALLSLKTRNLIERSLELEYQSKKIKEEEEKAFKMISTKQKLVLGESLDEDEDPKESSEGEGDDGQ